LRRGFCTPVVHQPQKIRERLGGSANMTEPFQEKPKGMHWRTYDLSSIDKSIV
jgi:hypothetical protein